MITKEGELITKIEKAMVNEDNYDIDGYMDRAEEIARQKIEIYSQLLRNISMFRDKHGRARY